MKLHLQGLEGPDGVRRITNSLLRADIGGRINFDAQAQVLRLECRLSLGDAVAAIERGGGAVVQVLDGTTSDSAYRPLRA